MTVRCSLRKNWQKWKYSGGLKREFELYVKIIEFGLYLLIDAQDERYTQYVDCIDTIVQ